jgi:hypothetical protein
MLNTLGVTEEGDDDNMIFCGFAEYGVWKDQDAQEGGWIGLF